jgi:hypothetical protein
MSPPDARTASVLIVSAMRATLATVTHQAAAEAMRCRTPHDKKKPPPLLPGGGLKVGLDSDDDASTRLMTG